MTEYAPGVITPPELFELVRWVDERFDAQMGTPRAYMTTLDGEKHFYETYGFVGPTLKDACDLFRRHLEALRSEAPGRRRVLYWRMLPHRDGEHAVRARLVVLA